MYTLFSRFIFLFLILISYFSLWTERRKNANRSPSHNGKNVRSLRRIFKLAVAGSLMGFSVSENVSVCVCVFNVRVLNVIHLKFFPSFLYIPPAQISFRIFMSLRLFNVLCIFRKPFTRFIIDTRCTYFHDVVSWQFCWNDEEKMNKLFAMWYAHVLPKHLVGCH